MDYDNLTTDAYEVIKSSDGKYFQTRTGFNYSFLFVPSSKNS